MGLRLACEHVHLHKRMCSAGGMPTARTPAGDTGANKKIATSLRSSPEGCSSSAMTIAGRVRSGVRTHQNAIFDGGFSPTKNRGKQSEGSDWIVLKQSAKT